MLLKDLYLLESELHGVQKFTFSKIIKYYIYHILAIYYDLS